METVLFFAQQYRLEAREKIIQTKKYLDIC